MKYLTKEAVHQMPIFLNAAKKMKLLAAPQSTQGVIKQIIPLPKGRGTLVRDVPLANNPPEPMAVGKYFQSITPGRNI